MTSEDDDIETVTGLLARIAPGMVPRDPIAMHLRRLASHDRFLNRCVLDGLAPLVYRNLKGLGLLSVLPGSIRQSFATCYYRTLADNLRHFENLREIARQQLPLIVLKGPALIHLVYRDPGLRPMTDLDILVRTEDRRSLEEALERLGYAPVPLYPNLFRREHTVLDLHTDPINRTRIEGRGNAIRFDIGALWQQARPLPGFPPFRILGVGDQLLTLAVHALKHGFQQKIWLLDIAGCVDALNAQEAWTDVVEQSRTTATAEILVLALHMLQVRLRWKLPTAAAETLRSHPIHPLKRRLLHAASEPGMPLFLEPLILFQTIAGRRRKIAYLLETVFPRPEILAQTSKLPGPGGAWLSYPYRLAQLFGLACKCAFRAGGRLLKPSEKTASADYP